MGIVKFNKSRVPGFTNVLEDFLGRDVSDFLGTSADVPAVNVKEEDKGFHVDVAAPGMEKGDFKVNIDNDTLTISAEKELNEEESNEKYSRKEFSYSSFSRSFVLPKTADKNKIEAKYENGILALFIPKIADKDIKNVKSIEIK
ncbi:MAG: Hsp20/alpha crystallin family protein [Sporocytophaga sp.]|nr:Hsp20/alpha crystallin family protein [Sporocytophaga sp.]